MKELLFKASALGINIRFYPVTVEEYEEWVNMQGKNRYILTLRRPMADSKCADEVLL